MEINESSCLYNKRVECTKHVGCDTCGWNPPINEKRVKAIRKRFTEDKHPKMIIEYPKGWGKHV